ncbi:MAG: 6-phosphogluconolactonase, partial [Planctomycetota bacterium]
IVDHVTMPGNNFHPMGVLDKGGDQAYENDLRRLLGAEGVGGRLDYALLGMGGDGHTASLFPQTPGLDESNRWIVFNDGELVADPRPRLTMTYPLINSARYIAVLVTGAGKHERLVDVAKAGRDIHRVPITGVIPTADDIDLVWYLDHAAATGQDFDPDEEINLAE